MTQKTILVIWEMGGQWGHMSRLMPMIEAMDFGGHEVIFCSAQKEALSIWKLPKGVVTIASPRVKIETKYSQIPIDHHELLLRCGFNAEQSTVDILKQWLSIFEKIQPDCILIDSSPLALLAARHADIPAYAYGHGFDIPSLLQPSPTSNEYKLPCFLPASSDQAGINEQRQIDARSKFMSNIEFLLGHLGVASKDCADKDLRWLFPTHQSILAISPSLDHFGRSNHYDNCYVGAIWSSASKEILQWPARGQQEVDRPIRLLCYVNWSSPAMLLLVRCIQKMNEAHQPIHAIMLAPNFPNPQSLESPRIQVLSRPINTGSLVAQSDAVLCHAGMGLVSEALAHGKRLILLPQQLEQTLLSWRLHHAKLATASIRYQDEQSMSSVIKKGLDAQTVRLNGLDEQSPARAVQAVLRKMRIQS